MIRTLSKCALTVALTAGSMASLAGGLDGMNPAVADRAEEALACAQQSNADLPDTMLIADMSLPSSQPRLWVLDITDPDHPKVVLKDWVAHGAGSDPGKTGQAIHFSNIIDSGMTSLGLYRIAENYIGKKGSSWRLDGLMPGFNDDARERAVVLHPAAYVTPGHVGRSLGCPAVRPSTIAFLKSRKVSDNALLWIDGPDSRLDKTVSKCAARAKARLPWSGGWPSWLPQQPVRVCSIPSAFTTTRTS